LTIIPLPTAWTVAEADLLESMDVMPALSRANKLGPVLVHPESRRAWWLLPPDAAGHVDDIRRLAVWPPGQALRCPLPGDYGHGYGWIEGPDGTGHLTDPAALRAAFSRFKGSTTQASYDGHADGNLS